MLGLAVFIYGMAVSVTLSICGRNRQLGRPHAPMLRAFGYVLCGMSLGAAGGMAMLAATDPASATLPVGKGLGGEAPAAQSLGAFDQVGRVAHRPAAGGLDVGQLVP